MNWSFTLLSSRFSVPVHVRCNFRCSLFAVRDSRFENRERGTSNKLRERLTGLFSINGTLHDTYRQSWVATVARAYIAAGREPLVADYKDLAAIDRLGAEQLGIILENIRTNGCG